MLQQTQVSRVTERFITFIERFPTIADLATADEQQVLALWSGLGYYRRARNLHAAARMIVHDFAGRVPPHVDDLSQLPGVGPYTAGAIASIVFSKPEPAVDANIARVLVRIEGRDDLTTAPARTKWAISQSREVLLRAQSPGTVNEGLMELGALICTPRSPRCKSCPLSRLCKAKRLGIQSSIPAPKQATTRSLIHHAAVIVRDARGRILVEKRPSNRHTMWAGLWQPPAVERTDRPSKSAELRKALGLSRATLGFEFQHITTHRLIRFSVWDGMPSKGHTPTRGIYRTKSQIARLPLSSPHRRILLADKGTNADRETFAVQ